MFFHQVYEEYAEQADIWLASKEAFLANEDLGVSGSKDVREQASHTISTCSVSMIIVTNLISIFSADEPTSSLYVRLQNFGILNYETNHYARNSPLITLTPEEECGEFIWVCLSACLNVCLDA